MKKTIVCDRCGVEICEEALYRQRIGLSVGSQSGVPGGSVAIQEIVDLCGDCGCLLLKNQLRIRTFAAVKDEWEANRRILEWVKRGC